jgi:hypothetical protein
VRGLALALTAMVLAGCSTMQAINPWQSGSLPPKTAQVQAIQHQPGPDNANPLLRLVGTMPVTVDQTFREPATGELLKVRVVRAYTAASGRQCREYQVTNQSGQQANRVACVNGERWVEARPLRQGGTGSAATRAQ